MGRTPRSEPRPVKIWTWPKIIFLYPTLVAAIICAVGSLLFEDQARLWGTIFVTVFFVNLLVMSFDFPRTSSLNLFLLVIAVILGAVLINQRFTFLPQLRDLMSGFTPEANTQFYAIFAGSLAFVYLVVLLVDFRFDYWLVRPNEIIHRRGVLGNVSRYPAPGLELQKEITDVFEYLLFGSGRLVIQPTKGPAIVLENVFRINDKERRIQALLDAINVEISPREEITTVR